MEAVAMGAIGARGGPGTMIGSADRYSSAFSASGVAGGALSSGSGGQPKSFEVLIHGRIESAQLAGVGEVSCAFELVFGPDWQAQSGVSGGETQGARNQQDAHDKPSAVWNFPVQMLMMATNVAGWPRLVLTVRDSGRNIVGYGSVLVPTRDGQSTKYCRLFSPLASTTLGDALARVTSELPEFYDSRFSAACPGREAARVASAGVVKVTFSTRVVGRESFGYR